MVENNLDNLADDARDAVDETVDNVKESFEDAKDKAEDVYEDAKDKVEDAYDAAKDKAEDIVAEVKETAGEVSDAVADKVEEVFPAAAPVVPPVVPAAAPAAQQPLPAPAPVANDLATAALTGTEKLLIVLGTLFVGWFVPLIVWFVWKDNQPVKAKEALRLGIIVAVIWTVLMCCFMVAIILPLLGVIASGPTSFQTY